MAWFAINVSNSEGEILDDQIEAFNEEEAKLLIEKLDYRVNSIRILRSQSFLSAVQDFVLRCIGRGPEHQFRKHLQRQYGSETDWYQDE